MRRICSTWVVGRTFLLAVTIFGCGAYAGCKALPTERAKVAVEGKLLHDNRGVPWVLVFFYGPGNVRVAEAVTDKEGSFSLSCPPGAYQIALKAVPAGAGQSPGGGSADAGSLIQAPDQKGLKQIPTNYLNADTSGLSVEVPEGGRTDVKLLIK